MRSIPIKKVITDKEFGGNTKSVLDSTLLYSTFLYSLSSLTLLHSTLHYSVVKKNKNYNFGYIEQILRIRLEFYKHQRIEFMVVIERL